MIFKINGCDQMYCVRCKARYSWLTSRLINNNFHNPELQREQREVGNTLRFNNDFICGGISVKKNLITCNYNDMFYNNETDISLKNMVKISVIIIEAFWRFAYDYEHNYHTRLNTNRNNFHTHEKLRIKKLKNEISEKEWINKLCIREKNIEKKKISNIYLRELYHAVSDILRNCIKINTSYNKETNQLLYNSAISLISLYNLYNSIFNNKIHEVYGGIYYNIVFKYNKNNVQTIKKYTPYVIELLMVNYSVKFINILKKNIKLDDLFNNEVYNKVSIKNKIIDEYLSFKF
jgi:hypothetical protein